MKAYKEVITVSEWKTPYGWQNEDSIVDVNDLTLDESEAANYYDKANDWSWFFNNMDKDELARKYEEDNEDIMVTCRIYDAEDMENAVAERSIWASDYYAE